MNPRQRKQLEQILNGLPKRERDRIFDLARTQRSDAQRRRRAKARETQDGERVGGKRRPDPLLDWALRILADERKRAESTVPDGDAEASLLEGVVVGLTRRRAEVLPDGVDEPVLCRLSAELASRQQSAIAVGDRVVFAPTDDPDEQGELVRVMERSTSLSRPDPRDPRTERVVAANVDTVVIVVSVRSPPLHPRLIDRYLVAIEQGGASAIIAINKTDLVNDNELEIELGKLEPYRNAGIPIAVCRAQPEEGTPSVDELRDLLRGKTCAFVGHSGVGKSSLANALDGSLGIEVGEVRGQDLRGRHTTTASTMHRIADGIRVIDTPGVRFFGLADITPDELRWMFPEFVEIAPRCKFSDCSHDHEPGCAVRTAVDAGQLPAVRHETYLRLLEELRTGKAPGEVSERIRPLPEEFDGS